MGAVTDVPHPAPTTRDFVFDSENVDRDELQQDSSMPPDSSTDPRESTYKPLLGMLPDNWVFQHPLRPDRHIKDTPYGQLTLSLVGGDLDIAMQALEAADVHVEVVR